MTKPRMVVVRHSEEDDDRITEWAAHRGFETVAVRPFKGERIDEDPAEVAGTVLCGGIFPANDQDEHPFLREEDRWIGECLDNDVPMLGICLGAQQLALHLGADRVGAPPDGRSEFGVYEVEPTEAGVDLFGETRYVPQSHFHTFSIPESAVRLASSELFENQAFRYNRAYAFQFHAEAPITMFTRWQDAQADWYERPGAQPRPTQDSLLQQHDSEIAAWFFTAMDTIFAELA